MNAHSVQSCSLHLVGTQQGPSTLCHRQLSFRGKFKARFLVGDPEASSDLGFLSSAVAVTWSSCDRVPLFRGRCWAFRMFQCVSVASHMFEVFLSPLMKSPITVSPLLISQTFLMPG